MSADECLTFRQAAPRGKRQGSLGLSRTGLAILHRYKHPRRLQGALTHGLWKYPFLSTYRVKNLLEFGSRGRGRAAQGWLNKPEKPRSNSGIHCDPSTGEAETVGSPGLSRQ